MPHNCENENYNHNHNHEHHNDHNHDGHDHGAPPAETSATHSLYEYIDTTKIKILNGISVSSTNSNLSAIDKSRSFIKSQDNKFKIDTSLQSDADCQMIIQIPFTGICRLESIILRTNKPDTDHEFDTPKTIKLYKNLKQNLHLDFQTFSSKQLKMDHYFEQPDNVGIEPTSTAEVDEDEGNFIEHHLPHRKFNDCQSLTFFIENNWSDDEDNLCKIYYLEIRGDFINKLKTDNAIPLMAVYESAPNPLEHKKLEADKDFVYLGM